MFELIDLITIEPQPGQRYNFNILVFIHSHDFLQFSAFSMTFEGNFQIP